MIQLPDKDWKKTPTFLRKCSGIRKGDEEKCRHFVEGALRMARSEAGGGSCQQNIVIGMRYTNGLRGGVS